MFGSDCWFRQLKESYIMAGGGTMTLRFFVRAAILLTLSLSVVACAKGEKRSAEKDAEAKPVAVAPAAKRETIWDLFEAQRDANTEIQVNKYIWNATLDVLSFMPVESIDPFTGLIVTGYGKPPGGSTAYRATVLVQDPALDARSLKIALFARSGVAVPLKTLRLLEDAILTRARQMHIADGKL
ncbi:MAG: hypothetical protein ACI85H_001629 [Paracoccaceae bacterium]